VEAKYVYLQKIIGNKPERLFPVQMKIAANKKLFMYKKSKLISKIENTKQIARVTHSIAKNDLELLRKRR